MLALQNALDDVPMRREERKSIDTYVRELEYTFSHANKAALASEEERDRV